VQVAFFVSRLAALRDDSARLAAVADAIGDDVQAMRAQLDRVGAGGERTEANTVRLLEGQAAHQAMLQQLLARVADEKGVPVAALRAVLARFGEEGVAEDAISARLMAKAEEYVSLRADLARLSNDRPDAAVARAAAVKRLDAGDFAGARAVLADGRARLRALREQTSREEAGLLSEEAGVARLELRYRDAAAMLREAAALIAFDREECWRHRLAAAGALRTQGEEFGDNGALCEAIGAYDDTLSLAPREQVPLDWARTQNGLGFAHLRLGERESGMARLEEAVAVFQAALQERTRDRVPLHWALTQEYLSKAEGVLGDKTGDTSYWRSALASCKAALEEFRRAGADYHIERSAGLRDRLRVKLASRGSPGV
jgi:tetratricopeptide (TPR) repeat protein